MALKPLNFNPSTAKNGIGRVEEIQTDIGGRLSSLRENRPALASAAAQPALEQISSQEGAATRQVGLEGSLGDRRRADIGAGADLARQEVQSQSFMNQIQSETGLQQLENEFTAMFNDMANTQFSQALSGLGEEIDTYMAKKGRDLRYDQLAVKAQESSSRIAGRMLDSLGQGSEDTTQRRNQLAYDRGEFDEV